MTLSKRQLSKRKRTSNSTSDGEGTHPSSKRNAPPGDSSPPDSIESPSNSAPDPSSNRGKKRRRELTLPDKIIERIMSFLCIVPRVSESGGYRAAPKGYNITEFMKKMVLLCAERRLERARQRKKIDFGLEETVSRTLDWMRRLTHQHHYLDTECRNGGPSDFRERLQWADFNVTLAVEQLEREAEVKAKKQKALEKGKLCCARYSMILLTKTKPGERLHNPGSNNHRRKRHCLQTRRSIPSKLLPKKLLKVGQSPSRPQRTPTDRP